MSSGVIKHTLDSELKNQITDLYQSGQPLAEIARVTGVRYSLVYFYTVSGGELNGARMKPGPKPKKSTKRRMPSKLPKVSKANLAIPASISGRGCTNCPMLPRCRDERLWLDTLPCEAQLDFEVGTEYETDSSSTPWVMPLVVRVAVEAIS